MPRYLNHRRCYSVHHYSTRLMPGARRPPRLDEIALFLRLYKEIFRIDRSLIPFLQAQQRYVEEQAYRDEIEATLRRVYGEPASPNR